MSRCDFKQVSLHQKLGQGAFADKWCPLCTLFLNKAPRKKNKCCHPNISHTRKTIFVNIKTKTPLCPPPPTKFHILTFTTFLIMDHCNKYTCNISNSPCPPYVFNPYKISNGSKFTDDKKISSPTMPT
jgi:hypothetical protein